MCGCHRLQRLAFGRRSYNVRRKAVIATIMLFRYREAAKVTTRQRLLIGLAGDINCIGVIVAYCECMVVHKTDF